MRRLKLLLCCALCLVMVSASLLAQQATGKFVGTVKDDAGNFLPGVTVEATGPMLVGTANAVSDENGVYRLLALPSGLYKIEYSLPGFNTVVQENIELSLEQTLTVNVSLTASTLHEEVTVISESPLVDIKSTSKGMIFSKEVFSKLPRGRNFDSLVTAIPGVNEEPGLGGISVDGASGSENLFYVDGTDITNMRTGVRGQSAAFEFIEEVQVKASGYQAEFGGSLGGVVNVITRSGGNAYHGELIGYYSGSAIKGKERDTLRLGLFDTTISEYVNYQDLSGKDKESRVELGFNLGGYLIKEKVWFFASFLPVFQSTERHVDWAGDAAPPSDHKQTWDFWNGAAKITSQPLTNLRISAGFVSNFSRVKGDIPDRDGGDNPDRSWDQFAFDYPNWSGNLSASYSVGNNFLASARAGYFHKNQGNQGIQPSGPRYRFRAQLPNSASVTNTMFPEIPDEYIRAAGWSNMSSSDLRVLNKDIENRTSANLDLTYYVNLAGEHAWKAGVQYTRLFKDIDDSAKFVQVNLGWDRDFIEMGTGIATRGRYGYYAVEGGPVSGPYGTFGSAASVRWAIYLQDSWSPSFLNGRLTLNLGARLEKEYLPTFYNDPMYADMPPPVDFDFLDKVAPRLGFTYDVFGDASLKFFGSFGLYYDVMKLDSALSRYGARKWWSDYYTLDDWDWTQIGVDGYLPGTFIRSYNWRTGGYEATEPDIKPISQSEISFGIERKLMENVSASVRVVYKHLIETIEDVGVLGPEGETYYQANPGRGITLPISEGGLFSDEYFVCPPPEREYWAVNVNLDKRFANNWGGGISYTWSRLWGNYGGLASSDEWGRTSPNRSGYYDQWWINYDNNGDQILGLLNTDRPHQFKIYGSYSFDFGLTVGLVSNGMSGTPVSRVLDLGNWSGYYPDGRKTDGRTPFLFFTDLYAEYDLKVTDNYRIQISFNIENLFNVKTALRNFLEMNQGSVRLSDEERTNPWVYDLDSATVTTFNQVRNMTLDPRFLQEYDFYDPIEARIGVKFLF